MNLNSIIKDRNDALLSMDKARIIAYMEKSSGNIPPAKYFWVTVHKARTGAKGLPMAERAASKYWLHKRGFSALDDGEVLPPIDTKDDNYFKLIEKFERMKD